MGVPVPRSRKRKREERPGLEGFLVDDEEEFESAASADDYENDDENESESECESSEPGDEESEEQEDLTEEIEQLKTPSKKGGKRSKGKELRKLRPRNKLKKAVYNNHLAHLDELFSDMDSPPPEPSNSASRRMLLTSDIPDDGPLDEDEETKPMTDENSSAVPPDACSGGTRPQLRSSVTKPKPNRTLLERSAYLLGLDDELKLAELVVFKKKYRTSVGKNGARASDHSVVELRQLLDSLLTTMMSRIAGNLDNVNSGRFQGRLRAICQEQTEDARLELLDVMSELDLLALDQLLQFTPRFVMFDGNQA